MKMTVSSNHTKPHIDISHAQYYNAKQILLLKYAIVIQKKQGVFFQLSTTFGVLHIVSLQFYLIANKYNNVSDNDGWIVRILDACCR